MSGKSGVDLDLLCINTIRTLSIDGVQAANSGHPGTAMALAPVAYCLWQRFLRYDPDDPIWPNRDRYVLSSGHASMLLYSLLHLTGVQAVNPKYERLGVPSVSLEDIERFRQLDSKCPGHPEYRWTSGVETTTGPLGQGAANSVGMAIASKWQAAHFNRPGFKLFDYDVYAQCSDGDLMEGVASEAASLAGHLRLDNLCWIFDNNHITIEGSTDLTFTEDVAARFEAYGWRVRHVADANDLKALDEAFRAFRETTGAPTLIVVNSHIGYGSPNKHDTAGVHGSPLGPEEVKLTKRFYGWPEDKQFYVPDGVREHFKAQFGARGGELRAVWMDTFARYEAEYPGPADSIRRMQKRRLPDGWEKDLPTFEASEKGMATRKASNKVQNVLAQRIPWLLGGSADLGSSAKSLLTFEGAGSFQAETPGGRNFHFGIREHAMGAISNGLALCKLRPYGSTYLTFSDYERPAIRLAALMEIPVLFLFSHDSIGLGEDGPTHQPVEHLASLRAIPGLITIRPADANEVSEAWKVLLRQHHTPGCLVLTRQDVPVLDRARYAPATGVEHGAYILAGAAELHPDVILLATGSEVALCVKAHEMLEKEGIKSRVVSMPSWELFERQSEKYRHEVLPAEVFARVAVEEASTFGWERYVGGRGAILGMRRFGASAPLQDLKKKFGFLPEHVVQAAKEQIALHAS